MGITSAMSNDDKTLVIEVDGRFDASSLDEFRRCYENLSDGQPSAYVVDLKNAVYLDSSALGMLLVLRDYAGGERAKITIAHCSSEVKKIFSISNFEQLFSIQ